MTAPLRQLDWSASPEAVFAAAPRSRPLAAIWSGADDPRSRWTILAQPSPPRLDSTPIQHAPAVHWPAPDASAPIPFTGGWLAMLGYDLGARLEPHAPLRPHPQWPAAAWWRCDDALVYDRARRQWWSVGNPSWPESVPSAPAPAPFVVGPVSSSTTAERYRHAVGRTLDHIAAGDIYQLNLTHHLSAEFTGSPRDLFLALAARAKPWYGAYLEPPGDRAVCSVSPELFLALKPDGRIVTRPMKGTRAGAAAAAELRDSEKERAELNMIVDLLRNDLGRVCLPGSIAVDQLRSIESHAPSRKSDALLQATATISGSLRPGTSLAELLRASFPGGSVTGAPKIRAMQLIDALEQHPRGPYCGSIGYISDSGHAALNIAIRTALLADGRVSYPVGSGIVADSDPDAEWRETLDKARVFLDVAGRELEPLLVSVPTTAHAPAAP